MPARPLRRNARQLRRRTRSFANGIADNPGTVATKWSTGDSVVYRVTATLAANAPDSAQGQSTGSHIIRWEAQNQ